MDRLLTKLESIMTDLSKLQADVTAQTDTIQSAVTLLSGLSQQIAALKNAGTSDKATQDAIDALASTVEQNSQALAAAVTANTPAADQAPDATKPTT